MQPKLLAFDLDGTLAPSKEPATPEMGRLLGKLLKRMSVAVMSGQSFARFEEQFLASLPQGIELERLYLFPNSSAQAYAWNGRWKKLWDLPLSQEDKAHIMETMTPALETAGLAEEPPRVWSERIEDRGGQISFSALGQKAPLPEKLAWKEANEPKRVKLYEELARRLPDYTVALAGVTTVDITRKDITKPYGLRKLSELLDIPLSEFLYVGDAL